MEKEMPSNRYIINKPHQYTRVKDFKSAIRSLLSNEGQYSSTIGYRGLDVDIRVTNDGRQIKLYLGYWGNGIVVCPTENLKSIGTR